VDRIPKPALALAGAAALAIAILLLRGCHETEADRARAAVRAVIAGVEDRSPADALAPVSERYHDRDGLDKQSLRGFMLRQVFDAHSRIKVEVEGPMSAVVRKDGVATVDFTARLAEGKLEGLAGGGERWRFEVELEREDGAWRIVTHRRERLGGEQ
jgi:hypothetical protein